MAVFYSIEHSPFFKNYKFNSNSDNFFTSKEVKNLNNIFQYMLNLLFDPIFSSAHNNNQFGKSVFMTSRDGWVTPLYYLRKMKWSVNEDSLTLISSLFDLFVEYEVLTSKEVNSEVYYKFLNDIRIVNKELIKSLYYFNLNMVYVIEDLTNNIIDIIKNGSGKCNKTSRSLVIIWEALRHDPYILSIKRENLKFLDKLQNINDTEILTIVDYSMDTGVTSNLLIDYLIEKKENLKIKFYCFEEGSLSIIKSSNIIYSHLNQKEKTMREKGINIQIQFNQISIGNPTGLPDASIDLILLPNILHYIPVDRRDQFFEYTRILLKKHGLVLMTQFTAYSNRITHPLYVLFNQFSDFYGLPLVEEMKKLHKKHFKEAKSAILDTVWYFKKPRN